MHGSRDPRGREMHRLENGQKSMTGHTDFVHRNREKKVPRGREMHRNRETSEMEA